MLLQTTSFCRNNCSCFWCDNDYTSLLTLLNFFVGEKSRANTVQLQMYSGDFSWILLLHCVLYSWFLESRLPVPDVFLFVFLVQGCVFAQLVWSCQQHKCRLYNSHEGWRSGLQLSSCYLNLKFVKYLVIMWWLLGLQFVNTTQNDFTSRMWLLIQQLQSAPWV